MFTISFSSYAFLAVFIPIIARHNRRKIICSGIMLLIFIIHIILIKKMVIGIESWLGIHSIESLLLVNFINGVIFGLLIFLPSVFETMYLKQAIKAILLDVILVGLLFSVFNFFFAMIYIGVRLWSILFGCYPISNSKGRIMRMAYAVGRFMVCFMLGIYTFIYHSIFTIYQQDINIFSNDNLFDSLLNVFFNLALFVVIGVFSIVLFLRFTKYLNFILPEGLRSILNTVYFLPGLIFSVGLIALKLFLIFGGDFSGFGETGMEGDFVGGGENWNGEGIDITGDGVIDGFDINNDGIIETNILGVELGPLQPISGYVRSDGAFVNSYLRTTADGSLINNLRPKI